MAIHTSTAKHGMNTHIHPARAPGPPSLLATPFIIYLERSPTQPARDSCLRGTGDHLEEALLEKSVFRKEP